MTNDPKKIQLTPVLALSYLRSALSKVNSFTLDDARVVEASLQMLGSVVAEHATLKPAPPPATPATQDKESPKKVPPKSRLSS
jgi:hypothetical protein